MTIVVNRKRNLDRAGSDGIEFNRHAGIAFNIGGDDWFAELVLGGDNFYYNSYLFGAALNILVNSFMFFIFYFRFYSFSAVST